MLEDSAVDCAPAEELVKLDSTKSPLDVSKPVVEAAGMELENSLMVALPVMSGEIEDTPLAVIAVDRGESELTIVLELP